MLSESSQCGTVWELLRHEFSQAPIMHHLNYNVEMLCCVVVVEMCVRMYQKTLSQDTFVNMNAYIQETVSKALGSYGAKIFSASKDRSCLEEHALDKQSPHKGALTVLNMCGGLSQVHIYIYLCVKEHHGLHRATVPMFKAAQSTGLTS